MKKIIFIAAPAAGKGTQSELLCKEYGLAHISVGDLVREVIDGHSELGKTIAKTVEQGYLIDDDLMMTMLENRLKKPDCKQGYVMDGFPRNIKQAIMFDAMEELVKAEHYVFYLDVSKEVAEDRILGRLTCPHCHRVYNDRISSLKPKKQGYCDDCATTLEKRTDDNQESFERRYQIYLTSTLPLKEYYEKQKILYPINSNLDKEDVFKQIKEVLNDHH